MPEGPQVNPGGPLPRRRGVDRADVLAISSCSRSDSACNWEKVRSDRTSPEGSDLGAPQIEGIAELEASGECLLTASPTLKDPGV